MKKWLRNVNRGIVLLGILVIAVAIYLAIYSSEQSKKKASLHDLASNYINQSSAMYVFPKPDEFISIMNGNSDEIMNVLYESASPVFQYIENNEAIRKELVKKNLTFYENALNDEHCPITCTRTVEEIQIEECYMDTATVRVYSMTTFEFRDKDNTISAEDYPTQDIIQLLYIDGSWKIVNVNSSLNDFV